MLQPIQQGLASMAVDEEVLPGSVGRMPDSSNTAAINWESAQHPADTKFSNYNLNADKGIIWPHDKSLNLVRLALTYCTMLHAMLLPHDIISITLL